MPELVLYGIILVLILLRTVLDIELTTLYLSQTGSAAKLLLYFQVEYDPDSREVIRNGAEISLVHWEMDRYLNSHNVASPTNVRNYEVSGFTNYRKKSKKE